MRIVELMNMADKPDNEPWPLNVFTKCEKHVRYDTQEEPHRSLRQKKHPDDDICLEVKRILRRVEKARLKEERERGEEEDRKR